MKDPRKVGEQAFFDLTYDTGARARLRRFYSITGPSRKAYWDLVLSHSRDRIVLEYGCGTGLEALFLAQHGVKVLGIDISPVAAKIAARRAQAEGGLKPAFYVMDAEAMAFGDNSFDMVCGFGILHHLRLREAFRELTRVMKPEGRAVFLEPLGHNPVFNAFRRMTPHLRTHDEHPLKVTDLELAGEFFHQTQYAYYHLLALASIPLRRVPWFPRLVRTLDGLDRRLFARAPRLRPLAWQVLMVLDGPKKPQSSKRRPVGRAS
jgi:ubiquinone/menaquinone biosynthesis C-methylase UbiE